MHRSMANLFAVVVLVAVLLPAVRSDEPLKCYMCTSVTDEDCGNDMKLHKLNPIECTFDKMTTWQNDIQKHKLLTTIASFFAVDNPQSDQTISRNMACAKVDFKVLGQENLVTVRSCQTAKTETVDPCSKIKDKLIGTMEYCDLCLEDACNHSHVARPQLVYVLLSAIGAFLVAFVYNGGA